MSRVPQDAEDRACGEQCQQHEHGNVETLNPEERSGLRILDLLQVRKIKTYQRQIR